MLQIIGDVASKFLFDGELIYAEAYGNGHINDTYAVYFKFEFAQPIRYIIQRINHNIFKKPLRMMENISGVTSHISKKLADSGQDPSRRVLKIISTRNSEDQYIDDNGNYWRAYEFIDDATSYQSATPELFEESGAAFGAFLSMLSDYPAHELHETITNFHHTPSRFKALCDAIENDPANRAKDVRDEIDFAIKREKDAFVLVDMLSAKSLPLRVTHNDTKLNNVMIDNKTGKGLCVIDLDTVMPGISLYDFGDSIRFGASTGVEDETDLSKISMDLMMFEAYTRGWLSQARPNLIDSELEMMPFAAKLMTYECGIRFLADYLSGDVYFKTKRPDHNLDRARTQLKLVADMEIKSDAMAAIVRKYV